MSNSLIRIDEQRLENDVAYRFKYVSDFMGFSADDMAAINESAAHLAPLVPGLVDAVYVQLFKFDVTKRHFVPKQHGYEGATPVDLESLTLDHEQIAFRKQHLSHYLVKLVSSPYDEKMVAYLDWVGRIHTAKAGNPDIVVPLIQINALMGFVNDALIATVASLAIPEAAKVRIIRAFTKLLWIQQDLISRHYIDNPQEAACS